MNESLLTKKAFEKIGFTHHHGINIPLFALRSKLGYGVGEFLDLIPLIDWISSIGFDIIQLLPLNDSGFESSPYNAFSSCALNPIFLSLHDLPFLSTYPTLSIELTTLTKYRPLQRLAYEAVLNAKLSFLRTYFATAFKHIQNDAHYQQFILEHPWLKPYALFKVLKEEHAQQPWKFWHPSIRNPSKSMLKILYREKKQKMDYWMMIQFFCFSQMRRVKEYGRQKQVFLKGDIPILISPQSLDVWISRKDFNLDFSAGAPPDMFTQNGQDWGFPIFRWDVIEQDDYCWWKERLQTASHLYDLYRIDHIIGFFRIWAIERGKKAQEGKYEPNELWAALEQGRKILSRLISVTDMLPIGEDLGSDVRYIRQTLEDLGICGTRIPRWERSDTTDRSYLPFQQYPKFSLTTVSTHDSETLSQWWKKYPIEAQEFAAFAQMKYTANMTHDHLYTLLQQSHHTSSLFHINLLGEYLALFPQLVWENPNDERINVPGLIHPKNWCYRFCPYIEDIISHTDLTQTLRSMLKPFDKS